MLLDTYTILARVKQHLSVETDTELAEKLGVAQSTLANWRRRGSLNLELIISKCKDADLNWLILDVERDMSTENDIFFGEGLDQLEEFKNTVMQRLEEYSDSMDDAQRDELAQDLNELDWKFDDALGRIREQLTYQRGQIEILRRLIVDIQKAK